MPRMGHPMKGETVEWMKAHHTKTGSIGAELMEAARTNFKKKIADVADGTLRNWGQEATGGKGTKKRGTKKRTTNWLADIAQARKDAQSAIVEQALELDRVIGDYIAAFGGTAEQIHANIPQWIAEAQAEVQASVEDEAGV